MSLIGARYPNIRHEELNIGLTSTHAAFNAEGLPKLFERIPLEPEGRSMLVFSDTIDDPWVLTSDMFLVEDAISGLCGAFPRLWKYVQSRRRGLPISSDAKADLSGRLAAWNRRIRETWYLPGRGRSTPSP